LKKFFLWILKIGFEFEVGEKLDSIIGWGTPQWKPKVQIPSF